MLRKLHRLLIALVVLSLASPALARRPVEGRPETAARKALREQKRERIARERTLPKRISCSVDPIIHGIQHHGVVSVNADGSDCRVDTRTPDVTPSPGSFAVSYSLPCEITHGDTDDTRFVKVINHWTCEFRRKGRGNNWTYAGGGANSMSDGPGNPGIRCDGPLP